MNIKDVLENLPQALILAVLAVLAATVLLVPLALKFAGLTGQQIADVLNQTMAFFLNAIREFRAQNKDLK